MEMEADVELTVEALCYPDDCHLSLGVTANLLDVRIGDRRSTIHHVARLGDIHLLQQILNDQRDEVNDKDDHGQTALCVASQHGHTVVVHALLVTGADVNLPDKKGFTPLMLSARTGFADTVKVLIDHGADVEARSANDDTALILSVTEKHLEVVRLLLEAGADVNALAGVCDTALMMAARGGNMEMVNLLIAADGDVNIRCNEAWTALMEASCSGHPAVATKLIQLGAEVNARSCDSKTALMLAAKEGHAEVVELLLNASAEVDVATDIGNTALILAAGAGKLNTVQQLLDKKSATDVCNSKGLTALSTAAGSGHLQVVTALTDFSGDTSVGCPLICAARKGFQEIVQHLLSVNADPNITNESSQTALIAAAEKGHTTTIKILIGAKANIDAQDMRGFSALNLAAMKGHEDAVNLLIENNANLNLANKKGESPLLTAVLSEQTEVVDILIDAKVDISAASHAGRTALHVAAKQGSYQIAARLLRARASTESKTVTGETPIDICVRCAQTQHNKKPFQQVYGILVAPKLIAQTEAQAFIMHGDLQKLKQAIEENREVLNSYDHHGNSLANIAAYYEQQEILQFLEDCGVDFNHQNCDGRTAVHLAALTGNDEILADLIAAGGRMDIRDKCQLTPLHLAVEKCDIPDEILNSLPLDLLTDGSRCTPQTLAQESNRDSVWLQRFVKAIVRKGGQVNIKESEFTRTANSTKMLRNSSPQELLKSIGETPGFGHLPEKEKCNEMLKALVLFAESLCEQIGNVDSRFRCAPAKVGSTFSGVKVGDLDECDFLCELTELTDQVKLAPAHVVDPQFNVVKMKFQKSNNHQKWKTITKNGYISNSLKHEFRTALCKAFATLDFQHPNIYYYFAGVEPSILWNKVCTTVHVLWREKNGSKTKVSLDFTPAVRCPKDYLPEDVICHVVPKAASFSHIHKYHWRITTSVAGTNVINTLTSNQKEVCRICKALTLTRLYNILHDSNAEHVIAHKYQTKELYVNNPAVIYNPKQLIDSYLLKTAFLHEVKAFPNELDWGDSMLVERVLGIFTYIRDCLDMGCMPHSLFEGINILEELKLKWLETASGSYPLCWASARCADEIMQLIKNTSLPVPNGLELYLYPFLENQVAQRRKELFAKKYCQQSSV